MTDIDNRLKEIIERHNGGLNSKNWKDRNIQEFMINAPSDVKYLLDALELSQNILSQANNGIEQMQKEYDYRLQQSHSRERVLRDALEKLARLGNGDRYGNSVGNEIAQDALKQEELS